MKWSRGLAHANGRYSMQGERLREPHTLRENKDHSREAKLTVYNVLVPFLVYGRDTVLTQGTWWHR